MKNIVRMLLIAIFQVGIVRAETIFHLAMPVSTLEGVQEFYEDLGGELVGAREGVIAFELYGHSIVFRLTEGFQLPDVPFEPIQLNGRLVMIPDRHFGVIISRDIFEKIEKTMIKKARLFIAQPTLLRSGEIDEMRFMMIQDPNGYAIEIKSHLPSTYLPVVK